MFECLRQRRIQAVRVNMPDHVPAVKFIPSHTVVTNMTY
jgi:hypothetical protein